MKLVRLCLIPLLALSACTKPVEEGGGSGESNIPLQQTGLCGENLRIINGDQCQNPRGSSVAQLQIDLNGIPQEICTGTLITDRTILTAAHCVTDPSQTVTGILVGFPVNDSNEYDIYEADHFVAAPGWDFKPGNPYDIGIIVLKDSVKNRNPIPLIGRGAHQSAPGDHIGIYGYGKDENGNIQVLKSGHMILSIPSLDFGYSDKLLQARFEDTRQSICSGDSGGPVVEQVGGFVGINAVNSAGTSRTTNFDCKDGSVVLFADIQVDSNLNFILANKDGTLYLMDSGGVRAL